MKSDLAYKRYAILDNKTVAPETVILKLKGHISFKPGQFIQTALPHYGEATFAIGSNPKDKNNFELCIRSAGNTTTHMTKLLPGDELYIRGPYGKSWPKNKLLGKNCLIIMGGMGIVPLRPLLLEMAKSKKLYKKINIISGFKSPHHILYEEDLKKWQKTFSSLELYTERMEKNFWGKRGLITEPIEKMAISKDTIVFMCGPEIMFEHCVNALTKKGIAEKNIYISFERRMECGIGICQHCNIGKFLVCKDGPVFRWDIIKPELQK